MSKYIDADLLRKDIDNWKEAMADAVGEYSDGVRFALGHFTFILDSLQHEQPEVDLEKEIEVCWETYLKDAFGMPIEGRITKYEVEEIACHFYALGINA